MTGDEVKELLRTSAFRPFTVYVEGKAYRIAHPEFAALSPTGRTLIVFHQRDQAFDILDVPLIARVEVHEPVPSGPAASGFGRRLTR